jgi:hypothetical protein
MILNEGILFGKSEGNYHRFGTGLTKGNDKLAVKSAHELSIL